jgi:GMP synthase (glutamine-hydrolysing)
MRVHSFQHVPFEDIGSLKNDIPVESLTTTHWYAGDLAPSINSYDVLIVMGGPMGVYDDDQHPWLTAEKQTIAEAISAGKKIIGICLGAQLIACVLGAKVSKNPHKEIGWFPLTIEPAMATHPISLALAQCDQVFHWHGDTFELPAGADLLASSDACAHQAFVIGNQVIGFQCHLETTEDSAQLLINHCPEDLDGSTYVQTPDEIMHRKEGFIAINKAMSAVWQWLVQA